MMTPLKYSEIVGLEEKDIDAKIEAVRKEVFDLRMAKAARGLKQTHQFSILKRNIARLLTAKNAIYRKKEVVMSKSDFKKETDQQGFKKKLDGVVVQDKNNKTIVVNVERRFKHRTYNKFISRIKKYHAHDETNQAVVGDRVTIIESRPYSKKKTWQLLKINTSVNTPMEVSL